MPLKLGWSNFFLHFAVSMTCVASTALPGCTPFASSFNFRVSLLPSKGKKESKVCGKSANTTTESTAKIYEDKIIAACRDGDMALLKRLVGQGFIASNPHI